MCTEQRYNPVTVTHCDGRTQVLSLGQNDGLSKVARAQRCLCIPSWSMAREEKEHQSRALIGIDRSQPSSPQSALALATERRSRTCGAHEASIRSIPGRMAARGMVRQEGGSKVRSVNRRTSALAHAASSIASHARTHLEVLLRLKGLALVKEPKHGSSS